MTPKAEQANPSAPLRRSMAVFAIIAGAVLVIGLVAAVVFMVMRDNRVGLQPEYFVGGEGHTSIALLEGAVDVTDSTCGDTYECESAWGTDDMVLMKFATKDEAAAAARSIGGNAYRSDWLVANFIGDSVSDKDRRDATDVLDGAWQNEVD